MHYRLYHMLLGVALGWGTLVGCQGFEKSRHVTSDVAKDSKHRRAELVSHYENKRNQALYQAAHNRYHQGDQQGAREALQQLLSRAPMHLQGRLMLAEMELLAGNVDGAQAVAEPMLDQFPESPDLHHALGLIYESQGNTSSAVGHFRRATQLAPNNETYAVSYKSATAPTADAWPAMPTPPDRSIAPRANLAEVSDNTDEPRETPQQIPTPPRHPKAAAVAVSTDAPRVQDSEPQIPELPADGRPLARPSDASEASDSVTSAPIPEIPTITPPATPDHEMLSYRELDIAAADLTLPAMPSMPTAPTTMVASRPATPRTPATIVKQQPTATISERPQVALVAAQQADRPLSTRRKLVSVVIGDGETEPAALDMPDAATAIPQRPRAEQPPETAPDEAPAAPQATRPVKPVAYEAPIGSGPSLEKVGELLAAGENAKATALIEQLFAASPDNAQLTNRAALELLRHAQTKTALRLLTEGMRRHPQSAAVHRTAGVARYRLGDYTGAEDALRKAVALDSHDALAYFLLGFSLEKLGRHEAAQHHFTQAAQLDPSLGRE